MRRGRWRSASARTTRRAGRDGTVGWGTLFGIETEFPPKAAILATADELSVDRRFFALQQRRDGYWEVKTLMYDDTPDA